MEPQICLFVALGPCGSGFHCTRERWSTASHLSLISVQTVVLVCQVSLVLGDGQNQGLHSRRWWHFPGTVMTEDRAALGSPVFIFPRVPVWQGHVRKAQQSSTPG